MLTVKILNMNKIEGLVIIVPCLWLEFHGSENSPGFLASAIAVSRLQIGTYDSAVFSSLDLIDAFDGVAIWKTM
jgi:hypothetical protein